MALLWWALAFLPWKLAGSAALSDGWPPTLPVLYTDFAVATFGSVGASLVVAGLLRRWGLSVLAVTLGFAFSLVVTLTRGATLQGIVHVTTERQLMLGVSGVGALTGLAIGIVATGSLRAFGFFGVLAIPPVVSLIAVVFLGVDTRQRWLTAAVLALLLVMIAWNRWTGVLLWPLVLALLWLLTLTRAAIGAGAQTLRHPWDGTSAAGSGLDVALAFVRSHWRGFLGDGWDVFWPAVLIGALVVAGVHAWHRLAPEPE